MSYAVDHASALADVAAAGVAVTFTLTTPGAEASDGASTSVTVSSVSGYATDAKGSPLEYQRLGLTPGEAPALFVVASTYGEVPALGAAVTWGGVAYTVRSVLPYRPDGTALFSTVIIAR